jgi:hypothetical protein
MLVDGAQRASGDQLAQLFERKAHPGIGHGGRTEG